MIGGMIDKFGKIVTIQRATITKGGYTGDIISWSTIASVLGVFNPVNGIDANVLQKMGVEAEYKLYIDYQDIKEKDRLTIDGKYYFVSWVQNPMSYGNFLQCYLKGSDNIGSNSSK